MPDHDLPTLARITSPTGKAELRQVAAGQDGPIGATITHGAVRSALEGRGLITVTGEGRRCRLTELGRQLLDHLDATNEGNATP